MIAVQNDTDAKYPFKISNKLTGQASQNLSVQLIFRSAQTMMEKSDIYYIKIVSRNFFHCATEHAGPMTP